jgi:chaperonin GroEL
MIQELSGRTLSTPARQIAVNAGEDGSIVVGKISENGSYGYGYDAQEGEYGDLVSKGIIDPTKVVRTALQDAASIAGLLMTTEAMVAEKPPLARIAGNGIRTIVVETRKQAVEHVTSVQNVMARA